MLLDSYDHLFFNANFKEAASNGTSAYRGELIIKEGEIADDQGRRKPPQELLKQAALLTGADDLKFLSGSLDQLQHFEHLVDICKGDIKAGTLVILYVVNIDKELTLEINGTKAYCIPMVQGMAWNELADLAGLDKGDFKGLSAADKVVRVYEELLTNTFDYPVVDLAEACAKTNSKKREMHGAV